MGEWVKFKVGQPSTLNSCIQFSTVSHVAHVQAAIDILRTGKIRAGLVFDKSKLNDRRVLVSWVSPNDWAKGFRYGNIRFNFDLKRIIQDKKYYWVEAIAYGVSACRILISDNKHDDLDEYHPEDRNGPWWYDCNNDIHYYNNNYCLELMVEDDIEIESSISIDTVNHHQTWCSENRNNPNRCKELGMPSSEAGALFIATLLGRNQKLDISLFDLNQKQVPFVLYQAFSFLYRILVNSKSAKYGGAIRETDAHAEAMTKALCNAYATERHEDIAVLQSCFKNKEVLEISLAKVIANHFDLLNYNSLLEE